MRESHRHRVLRSTALALCAAVAIGASAGQAGGEEPVGQPARGMPTAPPFIDTRPGETLPDLLLEDGHGRRFRLSETRGRPLVLALGFAPLKWLHGVRTLQVIAGHRDRAAVLHLATVPTIQPEDAPGSPRVPAWDIARQHRDDTAWLAGAGADPARSVRRVPEGPGDGTRPLYFRDGRPPVIVISDAEGVVQQIILRDTSTEAQVNRFVLLDAAITCAGGGPPIYEDGRALVASGRLPACASLDHPLGEPDSVRRGGAPPAASPSPRTSR